MHRHTATEVWILAHPMSDPLVTLTQVAEDFAPWVKCTAKFHNGFARYAPLFRALSDATFDSQEWWSAHRAIRARDLLLTTAHSRLWDVSRFGHLLLGINVASGESFMRTSPMWNVLSAQYQNENGTTS